MIILFHGYVKQTMEICSILCATNVTLKLGFDEILSPGNASHGRQRATHRDHKFKMFKY